VQRYDKNFSRIDFTPPKKPVIVKANAASIEELFTILVDNALKYSPEKSRIHASLNQENKQAVFMITNEGKGIPREKLPHIFDRFYRADESRTEKGAGLGLSLAKEIVAIHKGELTVSSAEGKETTFSVFLPIIRKNQA
jgi:signal transduction histidine kinase